ncbi:Ctr copper transporter family-domain-containing protein [Geopyxis carbonaria]|nr:Ctr copper transporter family-domain-containing protein [Geopyxis carbonaria]
MCGCSNHSAASSMAADSSMAAESSMAMDSGSCGMSMGGMAMTFTTHWRNTPLLFNSWAPSTGAQLFGTLAAIFFAAIFTRVLLLARSWLERRYWNPKGSIQQEFAIGRDLGRATLAGVTAVMAYALMLVAMSYVVAYFFAIIVGLMVAEVLGARLVGGGGGGGHC